jgi:predicted transcriptional regulator
VYSEDARTFFRQITPRRFDLLEELHRCRPMSINALAKLLDRNYKNVHDDMKALQSIGLIERGEDRQYSVPWDVINTSFKLAT